MELLTPFNYDARKHSKKFALECKDKSLTQQQFKDECDINVLFQRYLETNEMPQVQDTLAYGDFTGIFDYQTAMNAVRTAEGMFTQLPARIKNRFDNNPQKLLDFLHNEDNREEAEFLGLIDKPATIPAADLPATTGALNHETGTRTVPQGAAQDRPTHTGTAPDKRTSDADQKPGRKTRQDD